MTLIEQVRALIVAEAAVPPVAPIDPMGMMTGIPLVELSGLPELEVQIQALLGSASTAELDQALGEAGDRDGPVAESIRAELARRAGGAASAD